MGINMGSVPNSLGKNSDWFFTDIRCGILHQAETRGGWKIQRKGTLLDDHNKTMNATVFLLVSCRRLSSSTPPRFG